MSNRIEYPLPPSKHDDNAMECYSRFMRHLRHVPNSRDEIKVLSAIQFTADMMMSNDAQISKMLVDMGLRAPRAAFPASYLEFADNSLMRSGWEVGGPTVSLTELKTFWDNIGEDKFAGFRRDYTLLAEPV